MVTWSAQKTSRAMPTHFVCSLLQVFMRDSLMLKCFCLTTPLAWELYGEILILWFPYFSERYPAAAMNAGPLSVTTSATPPHWQRISSKMKSPRVFSFSFQNGCHLAHDESTQHAWTR